MAQKKKPAKQDADAAVDDAALWQAVADGVEPLAPEAKNVASDILEALALDKKAKTKDAPPPLPAPQKQIRPQTPSAPVRPPAAPPPTLAHGTVAGLDKRTAERMRRGQLKPEGRLDLHGLTQDEAHRALTTFIAGAHAAGKRQVLVITGKGERGAGVLKAAVPRWLNGAGLRDKIVAFDYAQPKDGGEGALYVRLRKPKPA